MPRTVLAAVCLMLVQAAAGLAQSPAHVWELQEIELRALASVRESVRRGGVLGRSEGPGLREARLRLLGRRATSPRAVCRDRAGEWSWTSGSNQPADTGLNGKTGRFTARDWTEAGEAAEPEPARIPAARRQRPRAAVRRRHAVLPAGRHLAGRRDLASAADGRRRPTRLRGRRRASPSSRPWRSASGRDSTPSA